MAEPATRPPESLRGVFTGSLAYCAGALSFGEGADGFLRSADLLRPPVLDGVLERFGAAYPGADRRAIVSLWSQWYFGTLLVPATAAMLLLGRALPLAIDRVRFRLDTEGHHPVGIRLAGSCDPAPGADAFALFDDLLWSHLEPLVQALSHSGRVSTRLLWSNAGGYVEWAVRQVEIRPDGAEGGAAGERLLAAKCWPDGRPNPLCQPVRYACEDGAPVRRRRVCCLRYLLPGVAGCAEVCPLAKVREVG